MIVLFRFFLLSFVIMPIIHKQSTDIRKDPSIKSLLARLPGDLQGSFSDDQLEGLKVAIGNRDWKIHPVDIRTSFGLFGKRYYMVFVAGRSRRGAGRLQKMIFRKAEVFFISFIIMLIIIAATFLLYILKSAMGLDVVSGQSFGVWDWVQALFKG